MKLFKIQAFNWGWDDFDSVVIVAKDADDAVSLLKERVGAIRTVNDKWSKLDEFYCSRWPEDFSKSTVEKIGAASDKYERGTVIIASFNAG